jgi:hypothetical protein
MISKFFATSTATLFAAMTGMTIYGCLDVVVIHVDEPGIDGGDGGQRDLDASVDGMRPCEACVRAPADPGPGCANFLAICNADLPCAATMECAIALGCLEQADQGLVVDCGRPCAVAAGLDPTKPSINYVIDLVTCGTTTCGPICRGEVPPPESAAR